MILFFCFQDYSYDHSEKWPPVGRIITRNIRKLYDDRTKVLKDRLPILKWAPTYKLGYLFHDFIAGFTVGLTAIPQGIAYAIVAGLPPQYGLYSGFIGCFVYLIFGSSKDVTIGELNVYYTCTIYHKIGNYLCFLSTEQVQQPFYHFLSSDTWPRILSLRYC